MNRTRGAWLDIAGLLSKSPLSTMGAVVLTSQLAMAVSGIVIARSLGPDGRGIVTGATAWAPTLTYLALLGMNTSATVRVARLGEGEVGPAIANGVLFSGAIGGVVTVVAIVTIPEGLGHLGGGIQHFATVMLLTIPISMATEILSGIILARGILGRIYAIRLVTPAVLAVVAAVGAVTGTLSPALVVGATAVASVAAAGLALTAVPLRRWHFVPKAMREDLRFGVGAHAASILGLLNLRLDILVVSLWLDGRALGYYGMANNLMFPVTALASAGAVLLTPRAAAASAESGSGAALEAIRRKAGNVFWPAVAGALLVGVLAPVAIPMILGRAFTSTVALAWILLPGYVARAYAAVASAGLVAVQRSQPVYCAEGVALVITAGLLPLLLPRWGVAGAAVTSSIAYGISALMMAWTLRDVGAARAA